MPTMALCKRWQFISPPIEVGEFLLILVKNRLHGRDPCILCRIIILCICIYRKRNSCITQCFRHKSCKYCLFFYTICISFIIVARHPGSNPCRNPRLLLPCKRRLDLICNQLFLSIRSRSPQLLFICLIRPGCVKVPFCHKISIVCAWNFQL